MLILGIESSCDDTSVAIVEDGRKVLSNIVASQDEYHRRFGGVVPEIAARKHLEHILPTIHHAMDLAGTHWQDIDAVAVTHRPGLVGSLIVGLTAAKSLALTFQKPLIGIHHLEAHAYASCFAGMAYGTPHIALVASGGHSSLLNIQAGEMLMIGRTVDDAAGEAFDKIAKFMGLGYPGGPIIDRLAAEGNSEIKRFPRPMINHDNFNFSFSGLKTAVIYYLNAHPDTPPRDVAAAFQEAVVDVLITKTIRAARKFKMNTVSVVGGVAANSGLRQECLRRCLNHDIQVFIPDIQYCTDNAAMVAGLGYQKMLQNDLSGMSLEVFPQAGLQIIST